ncbi:MAG TPA: glycoside hydrolase family 95 protein [Puia sp.]|nr:glycoside hydrolase family 95 protein [Puia sp.]
MYIRTLIVLLTTILCGSICLGQSGSLAPVQQEHLLWYRQPARQWTEALPIGNGNLGAMIFGGVKEEHLQFNESTLWTGRPRSYQREDAWQYLDSIRALLFAGKQADAEELAGQHFMGKKDGDDDEYLAQKAAWFKKVRQDTSFCGVDVDDRDWKGISVPMPNGWEAEGLQGLDGAVWLRAHFDMPDKWDGKSKVLLDLGRVRDMGFVYVNGALTGVVDSRSRKEGLFEIASSLKRRGNVIAIQVINFNDKGGVTGGGKLVLEGIPLQVSPWKYKIQDEDPPIVPAYQAEYQPFGDLYLEFAGMDNGYQADSGLHYRRQLDIGKAMAGVGYDLAGVRYTREYFASAVDHALVMRVGADKPGRVALRALLKTVHRDFSTRRIDDSTLALYVKVRGGVLKGVSYLRVRAKGGKVQVSDSAVEVQGASAVEFYQTAATSFVDYRHADGDPEAICRDRMKALAGRSYAAVRADHVREYQKYYDAFAIQLGRGSLLPTDERIMQYSAVKDPGLLALYVQYGRYLLISSSRPGAHQPANLQGIWNDLLTPPWGSKYTTNINLEMNYWPSEVLNLSACAEPLFRKIRDVATAGAVTAEDYYKSPGWVLHHNTDLWCGTAPINASNHGIWQTGGAWLCHQLWEHFLFTRDTAFLREYYPIMRGAAEFFVHTLVRDPVTGGLISAPSNSPEEGGLVAGPTMDHQIIRDLFRNCIKAGEVLGADADFRRVLSEKVGQIAGNKIGRYGQLQEWMEDKDDTANKHRHISHLWAVFPGSEITWKDTALMKAARQSLIYRGDAATGWSLAWKVNCWARFKDGDHTLRVASMLLTPVTGAKGGGVYPNLFDAHPPFQIDGNFGGAAGVAEMLVQSQNGVVELLPALPHALPDGEVRGICARGGYVLNLRWRGGVLQGVEVLSRKGGTCVLKYGEKVTVVHTVAGGRYRLSPNLKVVI